MRPYMLYANISCENVYMFSLSAVKSITKCTVDIIDSSNRQNIILAVQKRIVASYFIFVFILLI